MLPSVCARAIRREERGEGNGERERESACVCTKDLKEKGRG